MGLNTEYFFDSYALIEITKGNPAYIKYVDAQVTIITFNLLELTYSVFQDYDENKAKQTYTQFKECVQDINWEIVLEAMQLKEKYKKRNLSYADCIGYAFAKQKNMRFLTGDKGFYDLENVEFVK